MARYIEIPQEYDSGEPAVFLAGGITGCPDWQAEARALLDHLPIAVLNPRWPVFPIHDPDAGPGQIEWEYRHLRDAAVALFWFPDSGPVPQPIALYELGFHAASGKPIAVGADPNYVRRLDVVLQLGHARPDVIVRDDLAAVCADVEYLLGKPQSGPRAREVTEEWRVIYRAESGRAVVWANKMGRSEARQSLTRARSVWPGAALQMRTATALADGGTNLGAWVEVTDVD